MVTTAWLSDGGIETTFGSVIEPTLSSSVKDSSPSTRASLTIEIRTQFRLSEGSSSSVVGRGVSELKSSTPVRV